MKKILMLSALPLIIFFLGNRASAETIPNLNEFVYDTFGYYLNNASVSEIENEYQAGEEVLLIRTNLGSGYQILVGQFNLANSTSSTLVISGQTSRWFMSVSNDMFTVSNKNDYNSPYNYQYGTMTYYPLSSWSPPIDFDTIYYNPQIPVPKLNIWYLYQVESYREDGVANFNANIDVPDNTEFYVELAWKYSYPQNIRVYPSDMKGTPAYDYEYYQSSDLNHIYSLQDMQQSINLHIAGSYLQQEWQAAYDDFIETTTFYNNLSDVPNGWLANARLKYVNRMGTQIPLYGNRLEVFARYWALSEDNQVVVGKWYHWQSAKGSATEDVPENYINYQELPGYAGTVENVPTGDDSTYTGTGETTGEQATTIINYAPNYPDYPTAVSYNHDNILLQMIQTSKQLPQFFGQFTNFLAITLAFIDPGVWAIIGFGFTCCIVIMIIKVL